MEDFDYNSVQPNRTGSDYDANRYPLKETRPEDISLRQQRYRRQRRQEKKRKSFGSRIPVMIGLGILFGVSAAVSFRAVDWAIDRVFGSSQETERIAMADIVGIPAGTDDSQLRVETGKDAGQSDDSTGLDAGQTGGLADSDDSRTGDSAGLTDLDSQKAKKTTAGVASEKAAAADDEKADSRGSANHKTDLENDNEESRSPGTVAEVAKAAMPSVVAITSVSVQEIPSFFGYYENYTSTGSGSGIIVGENETELLIATNYHVVEDANTLNVCFIGDDVVSAEQDISRAAKGDGGLDIEGAVSATVKGKDADRDLAVIAVKKADIPSDTMAQIKIARLGDSDSLEVGEQVVAIGNALGYGQTVTSGWISALRRSVAVNKSARSDLLQTDAAINPGNSGGALLNMYGEVIGINSAKYSSTTVEGVGYAIPVSAARPVLEELMAAEPRTRAEDESEVGSLGLELTDLTDAVKWMYNMPDGAFVTEAQEGGAAYNAGIRVNDIITGFDDQKVTARDDLLNILQYYRPGEEVTLTVARSVRGTYREYEVSVTLDAPGT